MSRLESDNVGADALLLLPPPLLLLLPPQQRRATGFEEIVFSLLPSRPSVANNIYKKPIREHFETKYDYGGSGARAKMLFNRSGKKTLHEKTGTSPAPINREIITEVSE